MPPPLRTLTFRAPPPAAPPPTAPPTVAFAIPAIVEVSGPPEPGRYRPALDGLRALAVVAVLLYHAGVSWLPGGWLGVDAFFVLSGYLITTLLLVERERTGRIRLRAFWARRARRLLPALLVVVTTVLAGARWLLPPEELGPLRTDALAALGYLANWRMLCRGDGYAALTAGPSPLQHTWSLGIEEQFYLVWPLLVVAVLAYRRSPLLLWCGLGAGASALAMAFAYVPDAEPARAYYGSDTRAFGLLVGCALGIYGVRRAPTRNRHAAPARWGPLAITALVATAGLGWALVSLNDTGPALYRGGLVLVVLAVAAVLAQIERAPSGTAARLLARAPLPTLGRISYEVYLWHWPVYIAVDHGRTGLTGGTLLAIRCALTLLLAAGTNWLVSEPVRRLRRPRPGGYRPLALAVGAILAVAVAAVALTAPTSAPLTSKPENVTAAPITTSTLLNRPGRPPGEPRITVFGDSVAHSLGAGLPALPGVRITDRSIVGCGIARSGSVRNAATIQRPYPHCTEWDQIWAAGVRADRPDVALVLLARWEVLDRRLNGRWRHIGQPDYDAYLRTELARMIQVLTANGARVVLATAPYNHRYERRDGTGYPEDDQVRMDAWNRMLEDTARAAPARVRVLDLALRLCPDGRYTRDVDGVRIRSDGLHLTASGVRHWVAPWLMPRLAGELR